MDLLLLLSTIVLLLLIDGLMLYVVVCAEWHHVDRKPTLAWIKGIPWKRGGFVQHLDLYFFKILPAMIGQRIAGQWIEIKRVLAM